MAKRLTMETARGDERWRLPPLTADQVRDLPASVDLVWAGLALDLPRELAYRQAAAGELEFGEDRVQVRRVGARYRVLRSDLMRVLGISEVPAEVSRVG